MHGIAVQNLDGVTGWHLVTIYEFVRVILIRSYIPVDLSSFARIQHGAEGNLIRRSSKGRL